MACDWGSTVRSIGMRGHINASSNLGDWTEGRQWLCELVAGGAAARPD
jgi:predicted alpha/beta hydrolase family esterase